MQFGLQTFHPFGTENEGWNHIFWMNCISKQGSDTSWTFLTSLSSPTGVVNAANWAAGLPSVLSPLTLGEEEKYLYTVWYTSKLTFA